MATFANISTVERHEPGRVLPEVHTELILIWHGSLRIDVKTELAKLAKTAAERAANGWVVRVTDPWPARGEYRAAIRVEHPASDAPWVRDFLGTIARDAVAVDTEG